MRLLSRFWRQPNKRYRDFVIVYVLLALNFLIPAVIYYLNPDSAIKGFYDIGRHFHHQQSASEDSYIWWILGAGNVMTLGVMCAMLLANLRYFFPVLPALVTLKGLSSFAFLIVFLFGPHNPTFLGAALLDGVSVFLMLWFAVRAHRSIGADPAGLVPEPLGVGRAQSVSNKGRSRIAATVSRLIPDQSAEVDAITTDSVVDQIEHAPLQAGLGFKLSFWLVDRAPVLVVGRPRSLRKLDPEAGIEYLVDLEESRSYLLRQAFAAVKALISLASMGRQASQRSLGAYSKTAVGE